MKSISLKRILNAPDTAFSIQLVCKNLDPSLAIFDESQILIWGIDPGSVSKEQMIQISVEGILFGYVYSESNLGDIAHILHWFISKEIQRRTLAHETLERYKEITLIYDIGELLFKDLNIEDIARTVVDLSLKQIKGASVSLYLLHKGKPNKIAESYKPNLVISNEDEIEGFLFKVIEKEIPEIFNPEDEKIGIPRIVVPLKSREGIIGLIYVQGHIGQTFFSSDEKLLVAIASQAASAISITRLHETRMEEERVKSKLERYIPSQLVKAIIESKDSSIFLPKKKEMTVLFSDIRNFTGVCEELKADEIVEYLNEYFTEMVDVIFKENGTVNKFVGDMIVALFGAPSELPNSEIHAIEAAIGMQKKLKNLGDSWIGQHFKTGIGINSGEIVVGNVGSPFHMDYTAIGDEVNIASRLQSLAKAGQILVSRNVYERGKNKFSFSPSNTIEVKGKKEKIEVFEVLY